MTISEFYLTLPSNTHVGNKTSEFRVQLPDVIKLSGEWDVALAQIQYPRSWNNVTDEQESKGSKNTIYITVNDEQYTGFKVVIPMAHYDTVDDLLATIVQETEDTVSELVKKVNTENKQRIKMIPKSIFWNSNPILKRTTVRFNNDIVYAIRLSDHLKYMLGYEKNDLYNREGYKDEAKHPADMRGGIDALYVYCDLIENQVVGNVREPLLRILPVQGAYGEIVDQDFVALHYIPLLKKEFSTVHISIKSDSDLPIPFAYGKVVVKLHFRSKDANNIRPW